MLVRIQTAGLHGVRGLPVTVEVSLTQGLPTFSVVGLPRSAVREGRERVISALRHLGVKLPPRRITVNLAPADEPKEGTGFDLPLAVALMAAAGELPAAELGGCAFVGELGLDGRLRPVRGVLARALSCREAGARRLVVAPENAREARAVPGLEVVAPVSLEGVEEALREGGAGAGGDVRESDPARRRGAAEVDLADIQGEPLARRALEIAAAGGHNLLLVGPPGVGKTLLARALPGILPPLAASDSMEVTAIHSAAGLLPDGVGLLTARPFRAPHHSVSGAGLVGGGTPIRPGEVTLAHGGVLFLDELPEFRRPVLDLLRQPLEDGVVVLSRARGTLTFPARFTLVAAMNPCPCGYHGHRQRPCLCDPGAIQRYRGRVSGPLLDRIDLQVPLTGEDFAAHRARATTPPESTARILSRVTRARGIQEARFRGSGLRCNAELTPGLLRRHAAVRPPVADLLQRAQDRLALSPRAYHRLVKVARTIADLAGAAEMAADHAAEAIHFRELDRPVT